MMPVPADASYVPAGIPVIWLSYQQVIHGTQNGYNVKLNEYFNSSIEQENSFKII